MCEGVCVGGERLGVCASRCRKSGQKMAARRGAQREVSALIRPHGPVGLLHLSTVGQYASERSCV